MASKCMLTTFDNPYNPFDEFTSWFMFDEEKGYQGEIKKANQQALTAARNSVGAKREPIRVLT